MIPPVSRIIKILLNTIYNSVELRVIIFSTFTYELRAENSGLSIVLK